jgi:hypothetical protein
VAERSEGALEASVDSGGCCTGQRQPYRSCVEQHDGPAGGGGRRESGPEKVKEGIEREGGAEGAEDGDWERGSGAMRVIRK